MRLAALLLLVAVALPAVAAIPPEAYAHRRELARIVQQEWGLRGSAARAAAQIHQESHWRGDVRSWAGAEGWAQFMPATGGWIVEIYPDLGRYAPTSFPWAARAMARYDGHLYAAVQGRSHCDRWWHTLRAYNGGLGHLRAESRHAADPLDRRAVAAACGSARRSVRHCPENLGYPERILLRHEPAYLAAGWIGIRTCPQASAP
jgi:soluble lytic murein transglycosylase-like protein